MRNKFGRLTLFDFKIYHEATKSRLCSIGLNTDISINGIEEEVKKKTHIYGQLIFDNSFKAVL